MSNEIVFNFNSDSFFDQTGGSRQAEYLQKYLTDLGAKTLVVENSYIDKNYLIDYQRFYSRSFEFTEKVTKRIHFFNVELSEEKLEQALKDNKTEFLQGSYLGFIVIKPIEDARGNKLIGRTLLKTYPAKVNSKSRFYVEKEYKASLFGMNLNVASVPFQAQDMGVSACATIALWTALQSLPSHFEIPGYSPAEITELSTELPSQNRIFPQFGLTFGQMINCIRLVGLDVEVIKAENNDVVSTAVKAYTHVGIPIIGTLKLSKENGEAEYHAVVIVGYQHDKNKAMTELYVHDDQIGPYSRVNPYNGDFRFWKNEWSKLGYTVELEELLVPIYHKIRLPFHSIYRHYENTKSRTRDLDLAVELYLTTVQNYKSSLLKEQIEHKSEKLKENLPRFLWIERTSYRDEENPRTDDVFDGTAIFPIKKTSIEYIPS